MINHDELSDWLEQFVILHENSKVPGMDKRVAEARSLLAEMDRQRASLVAGQVRAGAMS